MQLFLSVLFIIYLKVKFDRTTPVILWLAVFFYIKLVTDVYGIINYTSWITDFISRPVLMTYLAAIGPSEIGMITSLLLFVRSTVDNSFQPRKSLLFFVPAVLSFPIICLLLYHFPSSLPVMFNVIKITWIASLIYMIRTAQSKPLILLLISMLIWNTLWLAEVNLHSSLNIISEAASWVMFVISEAILAVGLSYFLLQIIAHPRILKFENLKNILPDSLRVDIEDKLKDKFAGEKLYKDPGLSAVSLADALNISPSDLTLYLNRVLKKNFNQYITDYRIEESKRLFNAPSAAKMTIEQVMLKSGFNSKSVFNTAFKKKTGLTPSQFRKVKI